MSTIPRLPRGVVAAVVLLTGVASADDALPTKKVLSLDAARRVAASAESEAKKLGAGGAIAVVDDGGHLLTLVRLDGTFAAASAIATGKARSAADFRKPTKDFETAIASGRTSLVANPELLPLQGGVPIVVDGQVVGAVGVAGANSAQQDDEIARVAAGALAAK
jgi:glc operon protein GlcG